MADDDRLTSLSLSADEPSRPRRGRLRRVLLILTSLLLVLVLAGGAGALYLNHRFASQIGTLADDPFDVPDASRPDRVTTGTAGKAMNILLAGSDARNDEQTTGRGQRHGLGEHGPAHRLDHDRAPVRRPEERCGDVDPA